MDIRPGDLTRLQKDIARVRKHEEERRARETTGQSDSTPSQPAPPQSHDEAQSISIAARLRELLEALFGGPTPSKESLDVLPEYMVVVLPVIAEQPKFRKWLLQLQSLPADHRNEQLERMARAFRIEDGESNIAATFDRLHDQAVFEAVCQFLRDQETN